MFETRENNSTELHVPESAGTVFLAQGQSASCDFLLTEGHRKGRQIVNIKTMPGHAVSNFENLKEDIIKVTITRVDASDISELKAGDYFCTLLMG